MFWGKIKEISRVVRELDIDEIRISENRVRKITYDSALDALADSIRDHGIIEPLIVRRDESDGAFHLVAGERRLRAAELVGLSTVPCVSVEADQIDAAVIAIIENLHREDLNIFEEAAAIAQLTQLGGMTQEVCARRLGVSQSYVANKLRLLRLTEEEQALILSNDLTERHSRALLRLSEPEERMRVLKIIIERSLNVASTETYIEDLLCAEARSAEIRARADKSEQRHKLIIKDIRLFYNSIDHAVDIIKKSGIPVESSRKDTPEGTLISILLPKNAS
ncbi:MAG: ParB/RepB/Spo0J family partition protein [Ruminococcaceae bacterium]|nr:ParB/RepB/Spo0J family partition protein [Oscillospiraceae bacterium]